jgi:hypothetical protein
MSYAAISPDYPFEPHFVLVHSSRIHHIDKASGEPILCLHNNPGWSIVRRLY